jgi:hypothetical protein
VNRVEIWTGWYFVWEPDYTWHMENEQADAVYGPRIAVDMECAIEQCAAYLANLRKEVST